MRIRTQAFSGILSLAALLTPPASQAELGAGVFSQRCYIDVPPVQTAPANQAELPVSVTAQRAEATLDGKAIYQGDVQVEQGVRHFSADYTELDQRTRDVKAQGDIHYSDGQVTLKSDGTLSSNLDSKESRLDGARYQLHGSPARGDAAQIQVSDARKTLSLEQARFTTCPPGQEMWWLQASSVEIDQQEVFGEAWNASLWLYDVPVFYFPYFSFPVKDERKSGLLYPSFAMSSTHGLDVSTPYYWNLAPNYDLTLTPRVMENRGTMAKAEFRYLPAEGHSGSLYTEYLDGDRLQDEDEPDKRWLASLSHQSRMLDDSLRLGASVVRVANEDYDYFNDLAPPVGTLVDNQLQQSLSLGYYQRDWNLTSEVRDYQILLPNTLTPHTLLPRLNYNHYQPGEHYDLAFNSELTNFGHDASLYKAYTGQRLHLEPVLTLPLARAPGYSLEGQFKLMQTLYQQQIPEDMASYYSDDLGLDALDEQISRTLPMARLQGGLVFDRIGVWNKQLYTQTLEPEFQYLYVPYRDQDHIGIFDSTTMNPDYYSLFSDRRFAGLDRISDANKISLGVSSRIYDQDTVERLRLSVGQSYNLVNPRVTLYPDDASVTDPRSLLAFGADVRPSDPWSFHMGMQYDTSEAEVANSNWAIEYQRNGFLSQLSYRFVQEDSIVLPSYQQADISQIGTLLRVPVSRDWQLLGAHYRDIGESQNIDTLFGLRYDSCCWALNLTWERENTPNNSTLTATQETSVGLNVEFKGLGSVGSGTTYGLDTKLLPYLRPYNLND